MTPKKNARRVSMRFLWYGWGSNFFVSTDGSWARFSSRMEVRTSIFAVAFVLCVNCHQRFSLSSSGAPRARSIQQHNRKKTKDRSLKQA